MFEKPIFTGAYGPMNAYIAPLRGDLWRVFVGVGVILAVNVVGMLLYFLGVTTSATTLAGTELNADAVETLLGGSTPASMFIVLSSFAFMALGAWAAALWPARRSFGSLIGPMQAAKRDFLRVLAVMVPLMAPLMALSVALDPTVLPKLSVATVLPWLPAFLIVLFIQISAEELVFRGYIMGQLAARSARVWVWMIVPTALFGAVHHDGATDGYNAVFTCGAAMLFALMVSDLTARTGNLGAAIALHFANNFLAMMLIGEAGNLDALALYTYEFDPTDPLQIMTQVLLVLIMWLAARFALKV